MNNRPEKIKALFVFYCVAAKHISLVNYVCCNRAARTTNIHFHDPHFFTETLFFVCPFFNHFFRRCGQIQQFSCNDQSHQVPNQTQNVASCQPQSKSLLAAINNYGVYRVASLSEVTRRLPEEKRRSREIWRQGRESILLDKPQGACIITTGLREEGQYDGTGRRDRESAPQDGRLKNR